MATRIEVPHEVSALRLLDRVDYQDCFASDVPDGRSPRQWLLLALRNAPPGMVTFIRTAQRSLGIRLDVNDERHPLGWRLARDEPHLGVLAAEGAGGAGRIIGTASAGRLVVTTQLRFDDQRARLLWQLVGHGHRAIAPFLVDRARGAATR